MGIFFSISGVEASWALDLSEIALLIAGLVLILGLVGEYRHWRWQKLWELLVIIGVAAELLADGGIFVFSEQLQSIANDKVAGLTNATVRMGGDILKEQERAAKAEGDAADAKKVAAKAEDGTAKALADEAKSQKALADAQTESAKATERTVELARELTGAEKDLAQAKSEQARLQILTSARLLWQPGAAIRRLSKFAGTKFFIAESYRESEIEAFAEQINFTLQSAGWKYMGLIDGFILSPASQDVVIATRTVSPEPQAIVEFSEYIRVNEFTVADDLISDPKLDNGVFIIGILRRPFPRLNLPRPPAIQKLFDEDKVKERALLQSLKAKWGLDADPAAMDAGNMLLLR